MVKLSGKCLCEAIQYEVMSPLGPIYNCHCSKCRRWHGSAFRTRASVESKNFTWVKGMEHLSNYSSSGNTIKHFCSICGSALISTYKDKQDFIGLPLGGLEQDPGSRPIANIFTASKSPWYDITDGLTNYDAWPPGAEKVVRGNQNEV